MRWKKTAADYEALYFMGPWFIESRPEEKAAMARNFILTGWVRNCWRCIRQLDSG